MIIFYFEPNAQVWNYYALSQLFCGIVVMTAIIFFKKRIFSIKYIDKSLVNVIIKKYCFKKTLIILNQLITITIIYSNARRFAFFSLYLEFCFIKGYDDSSDFLLAKKKQQLGNWNKTNKEFNYWFRELRRYQLARPEG